MYVVLCFLMFFTNIYAHSQESLIGGQPARPGDFPDVVRIISKTTACTASIVGPRTVLTAAHCVERSRHVTFSHRSGNYSASCVSSPYYKRHYSHDLALCKTRMVIDTTKMASIAPAGINEGDRIILTGYGCTRPGGGGLSGKLHWGTAIVNQVPTRGRWYIGTTDTTALCSGDSGGPAFSYFPSPRHYAHTVLAVNSRGNLNDYSLMTPTYTWQAQDFFNSWEGLICGINLECLEPAQ